MIVRSREMQVAPEPKAPEPPVKKQRKPRKKKSDQPVQIATIKEGEVIVRFD